MADEDRHHAVKTLKADFDENNAKLRQMEQQKRAVEATLRRAAYTAAQLDEMPQDVRTYRSVGKAYFLQPKASVMGHLEEAVRSSDAELKKLAGSREALTKTQESLRGELTELITALRRC